MPSAQTGRCRRCGGELGAGSQQGVCLDCIRRLQAAKQARESGRRQRTAAKKVSSVRRESVRTFTCVDCGERFFDVDMSAKRVVMVDGNPVCAVCLKKRRGLGLVPIFVGSALVGLALLWMYPRQTFAALIIAGGVTVFTGAYYSGWSAKTRKIIVASGLLIAVVSIFGLWRVVVGSRHKEDAAVMASHLSALKKSIDSGDIIVMNEALARAREALKLLHYPGRYKVTVNKLATTMKAALPEGTSLEIDLLCYLNRGLPVQNRWGDNRPIKKVEEIEEDKGKIHVKIFAYVNEKYKTKEGNAKMQKESEYILSAAITRNYAIKKVTLVLMAREDGEDVILKSGFLTRRGFDEWLRERKIDQESGEDKGKTVLEFMGERGPPPRQE